LNVAYKKVNEYQDLNIAIFLEQTIIKAKSVYQPCFTNLSHYLNAIAFSQRNIPLHFAPTTD